MITLSRSAYQLLFLQLLPIVAGSTALYINTTSTDSTLTKGYLTVSFDPNRTQFTVTNNHSTNAMFINYGCADLK